MSKVICDVCGTSYPESAAQGPICGCARPADAHGVEDEHIDAQPAATYHHVKGGRFSTANVRKRNAKKQAPVKSKELEQPAPKAPAKKKKKQSGNTGLIITIIVLLLAILAVVGYIIVKFFLPAPNVDDAAPDVVTTGLVEEPTPATDPEIDCLDIVLGADEFILNEIGEQVLLNATFDPVDTTDPALYSSGNEAVATVDQSGVVTAVDFGEAMITVACGDVTVQCKIIVEVPFALDMETLNFTSIGTSQSIYSGTIDLKEITWTSNDVTVAVVADGVITAVGPGMTTVSGEYKGTVLTCNVTCDTVTATIPPASTETTQATEATTAAAAPAPYKLKNMVGGSNSDVTLKIGEQFSLALLDADGNKISDVKWTVKEGNSCSVSKGLVKAVSAGRCVVVASYNGQEFECIVRVRS